MMCCLEIQSAANCCCKHKMVCFLAKKNFGACVFGGHCIIQSFPNFQSHHSTENFSPKEENKCDCCEPQAWHLKRKSCKTYNIFVSVKIKQEKILLWNKE